MNWTDDIEFPAPIETINFVDWGAESFVDTQNVTWFSVSVQVYGSNWHTAFFVKGSREASIAQWALQRRVNVFRRLTS